MSCKKNDPQNVTLKPGEAYAHELSVRVSVPALELALESVTFAGFRAVVSAEGAARHLEQCRYPQRNGMNRHSPASYVAVTALASPCAETSCAGFQNSLPCRTEEPKRHGVRPKREHARIQYCDTRFAELLRDLRNADSNLTHRDVAIALSVIHYRFARRGPFPNHPCYAYQANVASIDRIRHCIERLQLLADEIRTRHRLSPAAISIGARYVLSAVEDDLPGGKLTTEPIQKGHPGLAGLNVRDDIILIPAESRDASGLCALSGVRAAIAQFASRRRQTGILAAGAGRGSGKHSADRLRQ